MPDELYFAVENEAGEIQAMRPAGFRLAHVKELVEAVSDVDDHGAWFELLAPFAALLKGRK